MNYKSILSLMLFCLILMPLSQAFAEDDGPKHKVVIQVSTDDARTQKIALNNAINLQKALGQDNIAIEIVAYGPGIGVLTTKSKEADRVKSVAMQDIKFSACNNTLMKIEKKKGKKPALVEGVEITQSGAVRIMELQEQGYAYLRP